MTNKSTDGVLINCVTKLQLFGGLLFLFFGGLLFLFLGLGVWAEASMAETPTPPPPPTPGLEDAEVDAAAKYASCAFVY